MIFFKRKENEEKDFSLENFFLNRRARIKRKALKSNEQKKKKNLCENKIIKEEKKGTVIPGIKRKYEAIFKEKRQVEIS